MNVKPQMSSDPTIRFVTRQDYAQWLPLWDGYNAFYGRSGATALAADITAMTWARFFDAYEPVHALVAEQDRHLLGLTPHQRRVRTRQACGIVAGLLADARNQPHRDAALRQGRGPLRLRGLPKALLVGLWIKFAVTGA